MAENTRDIPERYGKLVQGFHPRLGSYGRRLLAVTPNLLLAALLLGYLAYKRPAATITIIAVLLIAGSAAACYSVLRPATAALTETHLLKARLIGWTAVPRERIAGTVFVTRLRPAGADSARGPFARLRSRGVPALWFTDAQGRRLLRFDGRIWDAKTLRGLSGKLTPSTEVYELADVEQIDAAHPHLITFAERHPRFRSTVLTVLGVLILVLVLLLAFWPELLHAQRLV